MSTHTSILPVDMDPYFSSSPAADAVECQGAKYKGCLVFISPLVFIPPLYNAPLLPSSTFLSTPAFYFCHCFFLSLSSSSCLPSLLCWVKVWCWKISPGPQKWVLMPNTCNHLNKLRTAQLAVLQGMICYFLTEYIIVDAILGMGLRQAYLKCTEAPCWETN